MSPKKAPRKKTPTESPTSEKVLEPKEDQIRPIDEPEKPFSIEELRESISWSTRHILLKTKEISTLFNMVALSQKKKYGAKSSVKLNEQQEDCIEATLSLNDNLVLFPSFEYKGVKKLTKKEVEKGFEKKIINKTMPAGVKKSVRIDEGGDYVNKKEVDEYNEKDELLPVLPSSLYHKNSPEEIETTETATVDYCRA